jgi:endonuclease YncB( thermonuclease family)
VLIRKAVGLAIRRNRAWLARIPMTPKGLLTVDGNLDIRQFWPATKGTNSSDGDTVHLKVNPDASFRFASSAHAKPKLIKHFVGAHVKDHGRVKNVITSKSEIKIRLQGIDAPELHFPVITPPPNPAKKGTFDREFRQHYGAGAARALHDYLAGFVDGGGTVIHATFVTRINRPSDAIDSHGRFVGDVIVGTAAAKSINTWLVENGWAMPLLYDSMTELEVKTIVDAWKVGEKISARPGRSLRKPLQPFDSTRTVKNAKLPDGGKGNIPKIFRRQATFWTQVPGALPAAEFVNMLTNGLKGKPDSAYPLAYFLAHIDKLDPKKRIKLASRIGAQGRTLFKPQDLVFREDPVTLFTAGGKKVTGW